MRGLEIKTAELKKIGKIQKQNCFVRICIFQKKEQKHLLNFCFDVRAQTKYFFRSLFGEYLDNLLNFSDLLVSTGRLFIQINWDRLHASAVDSRNNWVRVRVGKNRIQSEQQIPVQIHKLCNVQTFHEIFENTIKIKRESKSTKFLLCLLVFRNAMKSCT